MNSMCYLLKYLKLQTLLYCHALCRSLRGKRTVEIMWERLKEQKHT